MLRRSLPALLAASLATVALLPSAARAGTARIQTFTAGRSDGSFHLIAYTAAPGETNVVLASTATKADGSVVGTIHDTAGASPGPGCVRPVATDPDTVSCVLGSPSADDPGFRPSPQAFDLELGDRADRARIAPSPHVAAVLDGGPGNDVLTGGTGGGLIDEETPDLDGNLLRGGPGNDRLTGGALDDEFDERGTGPNGSDTIRGLGGRDAVIYEGRRHAVHADLRGDRSAGEAGEHDHLASDLEEVAGGAGPDLLIAGRHGSELIGGPGADRLRGGPGADELVAGAGSLDIDPEVPIPSPARADHARNRLSGGGGADQLTGAAGPDILDGGPGRDTIDAGAGADRVLARDRTHDEIACGPGRDRVAVDGVDFVSGCEHVRTTGVPLVTLVGDTDSLTGEIEGSWDVACPPAHAGRCVYRATLLVKGRKAGSKRTALGRGRVGHITLRLNAFGRAQVKAHETVHATLVLRTREPHGRTAVYRVRVTLER